MNKPMVLIEWVDSKGMTHDWEYLDEIETMAPDRVQSVGFLLEETAEYKTITQSMSETQVLGRITIPNCAIKGFYQLEQKS